MNVRHNNNCECRPMEIKIDQVTEEEDRLGYIWRRFLRSPRELGMLPLSLLFETSSSMRSSSLPMVSGIGPEMALPCKTLRARTGNGFSSFP